MNILVQGSETRIRLTKPERKQLLTAMTVLSQISRFDDDLNDLVESIDDVLDRIGEDGTYSSKLQLEEMPGFDPKAAGQLNGGES